AEVGDQYGSRADAAGAGLEGMGTAQAELGPGRNVEGSGVAAAAREGECAGLNLRQSEVVERDVDGRGSQRRRLLQRAEVIERGVRAGGKVRDVRTVGHHEQRAGTVVPHGAVAERERAGHHYVRGAEVVDGAAINSPAGARDGRAVIERRGP